jgi:hypothetical protein
MVAGIRWRPAVATVDSVGELLPILGLSSNSPDDFTLAHARVLKPLAQAGACVIVIDHLAKNTESRAAGPTGTNAKRRAVGGVSLRVVLKDPFTPGRGGAAALTVHKDRHGGLRRACPTPKGGEAYAGTFIIEESEGIASWRIAAPRNDDKPPGDASAEDIEALNQLNPPPESVRDVKERLNWGSDRAAKALQQWRSPYLTQGGIGTRNTRTHDRPCRSRSMPPPGRCPHRGSLPTATPTLFGSDHPPFLVVRGCWRASHRSSTVQRLPRPQAVC